MSVTDKMQKDITRLLEEGKNLHQIKIMEGMPKSIITIRLQASEFIIRQHLEKVPTNLIKDSLSTGPRTKHVEETIFRWEIYNNKLPSVSIPDMEEKKEIYSLIINWRMNGGSEIERRLKERGKIEGYGIGTLNRMLRQLKIFCKIRKNIEEQPTTEDTIEKSIETDGTIKDSTERQPTTETQTDNKQPYLDKSFEKKEVEIDPVTYFGGTDTISKFTDNIVDTDFFIKTSTQNGTTQVTPGQKHMHEVVFVQQGFSGDILLGDFHDFKKNIEDYSYEFDRIFPGWKYLLFNLISTAPTPNKRKGGKKPYDPDNRYGPILQGILDRQFRYQWTPQTLAYNHYVYAIVLQKVRSDVDNAVITFELLLDCKDFLIPYFPWIKVPIERVLDYHLPKTLSKKDVIQDFINLPKHGAGRAYATMLAGVLRYFPNYVGKSEGTFIDTLKKHSLLSILGSLCKPLLCKKYKEIQSDITTAKLTESTKDVLEEKIYELNKITNNVKDKYGIILNN